MCVETYDYGLDVAVVVILELVVESLDSEAMVKIRNSNYCI